MSDHLYRNCSDRFPTDMTKSSLLKRYSFNRSRPVEESVSEVLEIIESVAEDEDLDDWYRWLEQSFALPEMPVKQSLKKYLASRVDYRQERAFEDKVLVKSMFFGALKYLFFFSFILVFAKRKVVITSPIKKTLILDHQENAAMIDTYEHVIELFGSENTAAVVPGKQTVTYPGITIINHPRFRNYSVSYRELRAILKGLSVNYVMSKKSDINLFMVSMYILDSLFYSRSLFSCLQGDYRLMQQQYHLDPVKNHIFRAMGGKFTAAVQAHIHIVGRTGLYYDSDIFFSLGERTSDRVVKFGGRFGTILPVGSLIMERSLKQYSAELAANKEIPKYDIICIGNNVASNINQDIHDRHFEDFYEQFVWLVRLQSCCPNLTIAITHHKFHPTDKREVSLLAGSSIEYVDPSLSSYELAINATINVTFCSTLGFELIGQGKTCLFIDPGRRNSQYLSDDMDFGDLRISNYEEFLSRVKQEIYGTSDTNMSIRPKDFCLSSRDTSRMIYDSLIRARTKSLEN